jgi:nucleoid DNA-binding protein
MTSYVHPNIVMKALQQLCQTPLYISGKFSIKNQIGKISQNLQTQVKTLILNRKLLKMTSMKKILTNSKKC